MSFFSKLKEVFVSNVPDTSEPKKLDTTDIAKLLRGALMVAGAAVVTFLSEKVTSINFGDVLHTYLPLLTTEQWTMIIVPVVSGALSTALKFFKNNG